MTKKESIQRVLIVGHDLTGKAALRFAQHIDNLPIHQLDCLALSLVKVKNIDSTGLAILIRLYSQLVSRGKKLLLLNVQSNVKNLLHQIGLLNVVECAILNKVTFSLHTSRKNKSLKQKQQHVTPEEIYSEIEPMQNRPGSHIPEFIVEFVPTVQKRRSSIYVLPASNRPRQPAASKHINNALGSTAS